LETRWSNFKEEYFLVIILLLFSIYENILYVQICSKSRTVENMSEL
jgi:hypothetical protein